MLCSLLIKCPLVSATYVLQSGQDSLSKACVSASLQLGAALKCPNKTTLSA